MKSSSFPLKILKTEALLLHGKTMQKQCQNADPIRFCPMNVLKITF